MGGSLEPVGGLVCNYDLFVVTYDFYLDMNIEEPRSSLIKVLFNERKIPGLGRYSNQISTPKRS